MARNYVKAMAIKFQGAQGPMDPNPGQTVDLAAWASDEESLWERVNQVFAQFVASNPGFDWQGPLFPNAPVNAYVLLDKDTIITALQGGNIFNDLYFYAYAIDLVSGQQAWPMLINPKTSPRYTGWTDPAGEKHAPAPSDVGKGNFSGAAGLVDAFIALDALVAALKSAKRFRDANIVQFAIDQVNAQKWTITQAFDYLRHNGLT